MKQFQQNTIADIDTWFPPNSLIRKFNDKITFEEFPKGNYYRIVLVQLNSTPGTLIFDIPEVTYQKALQVAAHKLLETDLLLVFVGRFPNFKSSSRNSKKAPSKIYFVFSRYKASIGFFV